MSRIANEVRDAVLAKLGIVEEEKKEEKSKKGKGSSIKSKIKK